MNEAELLKLLRESSDAKRILEYDFDFTPVASSSPSRLFQFRDATSYQPVGRDATGPWREPRFTDSTFSIRFLGGASRYHRAEFARRAFRHC
jgi:hypothetical protein